MYFYHGVYYRLRTAGIPQTPARHSECFGESVNENGTFFKTFRDGYMSASIGQLRIYLVRNHKQVVLFYYLSNLLELLFCHYSTCRIVGVRHYYRLCFGRYCAFDILGSKSKIILLQSVHSHRNSACERNARLIRYVTGSRNEYLIARINYGAECQIQSLARAYCYHRLVYTIMRIISLSKILIHNFTQLGHSMVGGIMRMSFLQARYRRFANIPGSYKIGLTNAKRYSILHRTCYIEELSDT